MVRTRWFTSQRRGYRMKRFDAALPGWRLGALAGALLTAIALAGPASAANTNLVAGKAFDGDITTRWNVDSGDNDGSWIEADWDAPITLNKVVIHEFLDRVKGFRLQRRDAGSSDWQDAYVAEGDAWTAVKGGIPNNAVFTVRFPKGIQTAGLRMLMTETTSAPTIWEIE